MLGISCLSICVNFVPSPTSNSPGLWKLFALARGLTLQTELAHLNPHLEGILVAYRFVANGAAAAAATADAP